MVGLMIMFTLCVNSSSLLAISVHWVLDKLGPGKSGTGNLGPSPIGHNWTKCLILEKNSNAVLDFARRNDRS